MGKDKNSQKDVLRRYAHMIEMQAGHAVRPYRADGYVNLMNKYGTQKDVSEGYRFQQEPIIPDDMLTQYYEGNGLFAKIIDTPAEEAIKHGFKLNGLKDAEIEDFYAGALDELDWEETAMTCIKWTRLFGGSIAVLLVNDGRGLDEPLDWKNIHSIDDIRVYDRSLIQPDYSGMFTYQGDDPFRTRGSRLGMPEYYDVFSKYGSFRVHDSRCLVFQNGTLPENTTNSIYQIWGIPEYIRINKAIRDAEIAHGSAVKLLDRSIQAVYKMKDLSAELATEEGENRVLRRLQTIDMARGMLNSITIDSEGEDYDFRTFQFSGVPDVIDTTCNYLSALTSIPQTILFGRSPAGMNATGTSDLENWYNYLERIQKKMIRKNLRYLLSIIFQAGVYTGEIDEVPNINIEFNPLWSLSDTEQADLEQKKAATQQVKAQTAQIYVSMEAIDPSEVRKKLADSEEFDVENMLDEIEEEDLFADFMTDNPQDSPVDNPQTFEEEASVEEHETENSGNSPTAAPTATKLPQDMSEEELEQAENTDELDLGSQYGVGVLVIKDGKILVGTRHNDFGYGLLCGPGGHIEKGETAEMAAYRETEEEFGISPKELIQIGMCPKEPDTKLQSIVFLCTDYDGVPKSVDLEMVRPEFKTLDEIMQMESSLFQPFRDSLDVLMGVFVNENEYSEEKTLDFSTETDIVKSQNSLLYEPVDDMADDCESPDEEWICTNHDGGKGSGNFGHLGNPGSIGGSRSKGAWVEDFPKVMIHTSTAKMKSSKYYEAAKHGSYTDAKHLVNEVCKPDRIKQLAESYPDAIVVPVASKGDGHNQIPIAYADKLGEAGLEVDHGIVITKKANHTQKSEMERLVSRNEFEGQVKAGKSYIIVDDVVTNGGSINGLRQYIESKGGNVVASSTLTAGKGSTQLAVTSETLNAAYEKHGKDRIDRFMSHLGIEDGLESLTNREANLVRSMNSSTIDEYIGEE